MGDGMQVAERDAAGDLAGLFEHTMEEWQRRMFVQTEVARAVEERGYRAGWTRVQYLARQVAKLQEELAELVGVVRCRTTGWLMWEEVARSAGECARVAFDEGGEVAWGPAAVAGDLDAVAEELADLQVVLFCAAETLGELLGTGFDVVEAARLKAAQDVARGVR